MPNSLMVIHAHPDDEVITTGGVLAKYSAEGATTVLVTLTTGDQGDGPDGLKPEGPGHGPDLVARTRARELAISVEVLGITHLEMLGYPDSGMQGRGRDSGEASFTDIPVDGPARHLASVIERYSPDVVVTYGEDGVSHHPDHIRTHHVTVAALAKLG